MNYAIEKFLNGGYVIHNGIIAHQFEDEFEYHPVNSMIVRDLYKAGLITQDEVKNTIIAYNCFISKFFRPTDSEREMLKFVDMLEEFVDDCKQYITISH